MSTAKIPFNRKLQDTGTAPDSGRVEQFWRMQILENVFGKARRSKESKNTRFRFHDPEFLIKHFGLKSFEFGNWLSQEDRYIYLAGAAYAMKDFCDLHNLPYKKFGLSGKLSLAFGARGHSSASAHFEPLRNTINLTRYKSLSTINKVREAFGAHPMPAAIFNERKYESFGGAGALGHEYAHAFDCHVGKGIASFEYNFASEVIKRYKYAGKDGKKKLYKIDSNQIPKDKVLKAYFDLMQSIMYAPARKDGKRPQSTWYETLRNGVQDTDGKGNYWTIPVEVFARSFEVYLVLLCKEKGLKESFLKSSKYSHWVYPSEKFLKDNGAYALFRKVVKVPL